jgi:hypothetical protein
MSRSNDVLQIKLCQRGQHGLKFVVEEVLTDEEIKNLKDEFRRYRRRGFRVLDNGFEPMRSSEGHSVTFVIKRRSWRFNIVNSAQAVNELSQKIAEGVGADNFELNQNTHRSRHKAVFSYNAAAGKWVEKVPEPIRIAAPQAA